MRKKRPILNMIGFVSNDLTVISYHGLNNKNQNCWLCKCKCGNTVVQTSSRLKSLLIKTCGCGQFGKSFYKHGMYKTPEYETWLGMKGRCYNTKEQYYYLYGGKGISVCERWMDKTNGFINFYMDMGQKPSKKHSLDRMDGSKNYEPSNCRWATPKQQGSNTSRNVWVVYKGYKKHKSDWAAFFKISSSTFEYHFKKLGICGIFSFYSKKRNINYEKELKTKE